VVVDEDFAGRVWAVLAGNGELREIKMFGGRCFMLNGNMVAGTSKRGLLGSGPQTFVDDLAQQIVAVRVRNFTAATSSGRTQCTRLSTRGEPKRLARGGWRYENVWLDK
jgi:hypothetical protein